MKEEEVTLKLLLDEKYISEKEFRICSINRMYCFDVLGTGSSLTIRVLFFILNSNVS